VIDEAPTAPVPNLMFNAGGLSNVQYVIIYYFSHTVLYQVKAKEIWIQKIAVTVMINSACFQK
jgi:hypothetical protein